MEEKYFEHKAAKRGLAVAIIVVLQHKKLIEWFSCAPVRSPLGYDQNEPQQSHGDLLMIVKI